MKNYNKYICAFVLLLGMSVSAWGQLTITTDFSRVNVFGMRTTSGTADASNEQSFTAGGYTYKLKGGTNCYYSGGKILLGKSGSYITFPAISGRKLTKVTITSASSTGGAEVLICPTNSTDATTGGTASTYTASKAASKSWTLTATSANTAYRAYINNDKNFHFTKWELEYSNTDKYTVTFNAEGGTCGTSSLAEGSIDAGVTLPSASPSASCATEGWAFYGWSTSAVASSTTTAPEIVGKAGDTYYPTSSVTLHAVYVQGGEYTKVTSVSGITGGSKYLIAGYYSSHNHVMTNKFFYLDDYYLQEKVIDETSSGKYTAAAIDARWLVTIDGSEDEWWIQDVVNPSTDNYFEVNYLKWYGVNEDDIVDFYTIDFSDDVVSGGCSIKSNKYDTDNSCYWYLVLFAAGGFGTVDSEWAGIQLYKETDAPTFNSDPSCCATTVALSKGTQTNATISSFSKTNVPTCSSTDADRNVTITVAASTGYEFLSSARLTFTNTSGTTSCSYVSGPTGTGPYTFVYQFAKDNSGAGTFSVTSATAKTYTINLDGNNGTGHTSSVTATYNSSTLSSSITPPTREGYTFDGWYSGSGGTGSLVINTSGDLQANVSTYTGAGGIWTKDAGTTLYAKWTINKYKVTLAAPTTVAISATSPSIAEGAYAEVNYNSTVTLAYSSLVEGRQWSGWKVTKDEDGSNVTASVVSTNTLTVPAYDVTVNAEVYGGFAFSCAELTLTPHLATEETPIFITSTANKTVRSQDYIEITGNGLTPNTELSFGELGKFAIKNADGSAVTTDVNGEISANAYIFYTPDAGDTSDGLDKLTGITVSVEGAKPKTVVLTQYIIGRHLPADFVIAGKKDGKWYALPSNMASTSTPAPSEIAVDDIDNPSIAYTAASNIYGLAGPTNNNISGGNGQYVRLTMSISDGNEPSGPAPLFGTNGLNIGKSGNSKATSDLSAGNWWQLKQTNTSITDPKDAKYTVKCANNANPLKLYKTSNVWGQYSYGEGTVISELRLIPASSVEYTESEVVAWGQKNLILEVALPTGATQARAKITDGSWSSNKSLATTTGTSVKGSATKYNYTLDFTDEIDFAANEGKMLIVELLNNEGTALRATSVLVPRIIAADRTINKTNDALKTPWNTEVHVLPGVTLTLDASGYSPQNMTMSEVNIYPGATVVVESGTLIATTLILRNGWNRLTGEKSYDVARLFLTSGAGSLTHTNAYSDWYIDYDQYYPIAVPFPVATSSISYKNTTSAASKGVKLRYYSGELRAEHVQQNQADNWVEYTWGGTMPTNLEPSHGYIMTARRPTGKAFSIVRMPLNFSNEWTTAGEKGSIEVAEVTTHKDQVGVTAWGNENTPSYAKGWNIIANPYMSLHQGVLSYDDESGEVIEYANIPDINFKEYDQLPIATTKLKPSSAFLVQAPKNGTVTFGTTNRQASAPSYRREVQAETLPTQRAYIVLANDEAEDMMGILVSDKYSAEYEINADLEKLMGDGKSLRTYMHWNEMKMAYLAINKELAQQYIPVSVRIETEGEHTFSMHSASKISELKGVYLIDFETGAMTNLLESSYPFYSTAGTINDRFAINAVIGPRDVPTELDIVRDGNEGSGPIKFIYHNKVFILHQGVIYDSTGKKVREIKK